MDKRMESVLNTPILLYVLVLSSHLDYSRDIVLTGVEYNGLK